MIEITGASQGNVFGDALRRLSNSKAAMDAAVVAAKAGIQHNFASERSGAGPWTALEQSTVEDRAKSGLGPKPIYYRGGRYVNKRRKPDRILRQTFDQDSPLEVSDTHAVIGSRDFRVASLKEIRPQDSITALQEEDQRKVFDALIDTLTRG